MLTRSLSTLLPLAMLVVLMLPSEAQARRRGFLLITHGDKVTVLAEAAPDSLARAEYPDAQVGYVYEQFGLFWLPLWTWGGEYCIYSEEANEVTTDTPEILAMAAGVPVSVFKKPFFYSCPPLLALVLLFVGGSALIKIRETMVDARDNVVRKKKAKAARPAAAPTGGLVGGTGVVSGAGDLQASAAIVSGGDGESYGQMGTVAPPPDSPTSKYSDDELLGFGRFDDVDDTPGPGATDDEALFTAMMNALCCVMVSDAQVSKSEKKHIRKVMTIVKCPWPETEVDKRMTDFVGKVKKGEYRRLLDDACTRLEAFRGHGKERLLEASLNAVAKADGSIDEAEQKVVDRLMDAVSG